jgi:hypothetical protein
MGCPIIYSNVQDKNLVSNDKFPSIYAKENESYRFRIEDGHRDTRRKEIQFQVLKNKPSKFTSKRHLSIETPGDKSFFIQ